MKAASDLTGAPTAEKRVCQRHGEYEFRSLMVAGRQISMGCPACAAETQAKDQERERRQRADRERARVESLFQRSGIPPRFRTRTFDNYEATNEGQEKALRIARAYAEDWERILERGTCLILSGNPGTGKTHLACAIANTVMGKGHSALFTTVSDAMRVIKRSYDKDATMSEAEAIDVLAKPRLLVLDEIGADQGTDHTKALMFDIINKRYEHLRPTILLTNLDAEALRAHCGDRIMDRLREGGGRMVTFTWASHRS